MKECIFEANLEGHGWYLFVDSNNLRVDLRKVKLSEKGCIKIEDWGTYVHLYRGYFVLFCFFVIKKE